MIISYITDHSEQKTDLVYISRNVRMDVKFQANYEFQFLQQP